jgi:hypothetical protein
MAPYRLIKMITQLKSILCFIGPFGNLVSCGYLVVQTKFHVIQSMNVIQIVVALLGSLVSCALF